MAVAAVAGRHVRRRRAALAAVTADLRCPALYVPLSLNGVTLRVIRTLSRLPQPLPIDAGVDVEERAIPASGGRHIRALVHRRSLSRAPHGALLWIHGGGTVMGRPEQSHQLCARFARDLDILVVSVDHRLAPEHPFPDGLDDCYRTLEWLSTEAGALGIPSGRLAVGGDSAGGGLAAALCQQARDERGPSICFQLLAYPMLDDRTVLRDDHGGRGHLVWTAASNRFAWTAYLGHAPTGDGERPYAAAARCPDLAGLPPAWIGVGDLDLFHDEDLAYARGLQDAGVPCDVHVVAGMYHGADSIAPAAATSRAFRTRMVDALRVGLARRAYGLPAGGTPTNVGRKDPQA